MPGYNNQQKHHFGQNMPITSFSHDRSHLITTLPKLWGFPSDDVIPISLQGGFNFAKRKRVSGYEIGGKPSRILVTMGKSIVVELILMNENYS